MSGGHRNSTWPRTKSRARLRDSDSRWPNAPAKPALLEPLMRLEITTPDEHLGDVLGDVNSRRGRVHDMEAIEGAQTIRADVPLAEMFGYSTALRSLSRGRASYSMEPHAFEVVPENLQQAILNR